MCVAEKIVVNKIVSNLLSICCSNLFNSIRLSRPDSLLKTFKLFSIGFENTLKHAIV